MTKGKGSDKPLQIAQRTIEAVLSRNRKHYAQITKPISDDNKLLIAEAVKQVKRALTHALGTALGREIKSDRELGAIVGKTHKALWDVMRLFLFERPRVETDRKSKQILAKKMGLTIQRKTVAALKESGVKVYFRHPASRASVRSSNRCHMLDASIENPGVTTLTTSEGRRKEIIGAAGEGWLIIPADESAIILYGPEGCNDLESHDGNEANSGIPGDYSQAPEQEFYVQFVVIRNVLHDAPAALKFMRTTVEDTITERTRCRHTPGHAGEFHQVGHNAGPRAQAKDARQYTFVSNFIRNNLSYHERRDSNARIFSAASLFWNLALSHLPAEVTNHTIDVLSAAKVPRISAPGVNDKSGWEMIIQGEGNGGKDLIYRFPLAERSPPEIYLTQGYASPLHRDNAHAPYAMALTIACEDVDVPPTIQTRAHDSAPKPHGGDFVDRNLKVIMRNATGTLFSFLSHHLHGSTHNYKREITGIASTFSTHIWEALKKAQAEPDGICVEYRDTLLADGEWRRSEDPGQV